MTSCSCTPDDYVFDIAKCEICDGVETVVSSGVCGACPECREVSWLTVLGVL